MRNADNFLVEILKTNDHHLFYFSSSSSIPIDSKKNLDLIGRTQYDSIYPVACFFHVLINMQMRFPLQQLSIEILDCIDFFISLIGP